MFGLFKRPKVEDYSELQTAIVERDKSFKKAGDAIKRVDKEKDRIIAEYELAEDLRLGKSR